VQEPRVEIVEHHAWVGTPHDALLPQLVDLLRRWRVHRVAIDATGLGQTASRIIAAALGEPRVEAFTFSAQSKSELGFDLIAAVNGARLKMYAADGATACAEFWRQVSLARVAYRANRTMNFYCDPAECHDDYLVSAALLVRAAKTRRRRAASGRLRG
jgi:phage FluMu gp28-like protein